MAREINVNNRDISLDIAKGILIILMMIGHMEIPQNLRSIIYSFHMAAFIFYSGYCFQPKSSENLKRSIVHLGKTLLFPYIIWALIYLLMKHEGLVFQLKNILYGMSSTNKLFDDRDSVGQVYFLLLLFLVRVIYLFLYKYIKNDVIRTVVIVLLSLIGLVLGKQGYWLPWSLDISLFTLIFYHFGYLIKKYDMISYVLNHKICYFILTVLWMSVISMGGMSLYVRRYGYYPITVIGAISGSVLFYIFCSFLTSYLSKKTTKILVDIGKNTLSILLLHTIFGGYIAIFIINVFSQIGMGKLLFLRYILLILLQIILGLLWGRIYEKICKILF